MDKVCISGHNPVKSEGEMVLYGEIAKKRDIIAFLTRILRFQGEKPAKDERGGFWLRRKRAAFVKITNYGREKDKIKCGLYKLPGDVNLCGNTPLTNVRPGSIILVLFLTKQ